MEEVQRVQLKKIYVWRATLFGLLYGLLFGLVLAIVCNLVIFLGFKSIPILGQSVNNIFVGLTVIVTILMVLFFGIFGAVVFLLGSFVYNIISKFGPKIHFEFMEYKPAERIIESKEESNESV